MPTKSILIAGALSLSMMAGLAAAKSYSITLSAPTAVGANELKAGEYEVKVEGSQVILTDTDRGKSIKVPVTIEHSGKKYPGTAIEASDKDGKSVLYAIDLGGSDTRVVLSK